MIMFINQNDFTKLKYTRRGFFNQTNIVRFEHLGVKHHYTSNR